MGGGFFPLELGDPPIRTGSVFGVLGRWAKPAPGEPNANQRVQTCNRLQIDLDFCYEDLVWPENSEKPRCEKEMCQRFFLPPLSVRCLVQRLSFLTKNNVEGG